MGVVSMAQDIKKVHPKDVVCYKVGAFVQAFGKDAYIISYIFGYSLKEAKEKVPTCGFPKRAIPKVCAKLELNKINYIIVDTRNNYEVDEKDDNKNLNKYDEIFEKARKYTKIKNRMKNIEEILLNESNKENVMEKIRRIEEIVYEKGKI